jgi:hypothetical protein
MNRQAAKKHNNGIADKRRYTQIGPTAKMDAVFTLHSSFRIHHCFPRRQGAK